MNPSSEGVPICGANRVTVLPGDWHEDRVVLTLEDNTRSLSEVITTTLEHPFHVPGRGVVKAEHLKAGMVVSRWSPSASPLQTVGFRAAEAATGHLLVKAITITRSGLEPWRAYNLTVEEDHSYFVGTLNAWVHNADCLPKAGRWGNGTRDNADWYPDNPNVTAITGQDPIPFVDGYANFDKWARDTFDNLALPKTRTGDRNVGLEAVA